VVVLVGRTVRLDQPVLVELLISIRCEAERGALGSFQVN
jgi:hypothetical protein